MPSRPDGGPSALVYPTPERLHQAVERGEIVPYYQPLVSVLDGAILGVEALARWLHPVRGPLLPPGFIPLAEETGVIHALGRAVLDRACHDLVTFMPARNPWGRPFKVSVNVSGMQVRAGELARSVERLLAREGFEPSQLVLEVTETALLAESAEVEEELAAISALGVRLSLDDFGTGYSSLIQLDRHPFDVVKIGRSFVTGIFGNPRRRHIVAAVVSLARALGSVVIAEGVETEEEAEVLRDLGVERAQGFHYFAPMPLHELLAVLPDHRCRRA